ncbi:glycosyltransferase family 2 protein [Hyphobacterium sp. CCMP332]|nr:glycosyltransferase family 2 protein [Hyphobacterium sp. CCMP332]
MEATDVKISLVIIAFNEEDKLANCINSAKEVVDDILVVDSYSTDQTVLIAGSLGARVIQNTFEGHIEQKNFALQNAYYEHVLSLDADEALSEQLRKNILKIKSGWQADAYKMNRLTSYCGKWIRHGTWYPDRKIRLFKKDAGSWKGSNPHDRFDVMEGKEISFIKGDILHYTMDNISDHLKQMDYFTEIMARDLHKAGKKSNYLKLIFSPMIKFVMAYFVRLGFLDGYYGLVIALNSAHASFLKYAKLMDFNRRGIDK